MVNSASGNPWLRTPVKRILLCCVVDLETGMLPPQKVLGEVLVLESAAHQELDDPMASDLDHQL